MGPIKKDRLDPRYGYIASLSPEGVAWEFLRRNDHYVEEYRGEQRKSSLTPLSVSPAGLARKWGLRFPRGSQLLGGRHTRSLAA
jgi:hypothetical protein